MSSPIPHFDSSKKIQGIRSYGTRKIIKNASNSAKMVKMAGNWPFCGCHSSLSAVYFWMNQRVGWERTSRATIWLTQLAQENSLARVRKFELSVFRPEWCSNMIFWSDQLSSLVRLVLLYNPILWSKKKYPSNVEIWSKNPSDISFVHLVYLYRARMSVVLGRLLAPKGRLCQLFFPAWDLLSRHCLMVLPVLSGDVVI